MDQEPAYKKFKKNKSSKFKDLRHRIQVSVLKLLIGITKSLSISTNQKIGRWLGTVGYHLGKKDREIARYQLEFCFPEKSGIEREKIVKDCFRNFGQSFMEVLVKQKIRENMDQWVHLRNEHIIHDALALGNGAIILIGHFGNWEMIHLIYEKLGIKGKAIARPVDNEGLQTALQESRESDNLKMIARGDRKSGKLMLQCFRNNEALVLAIDQDTKAQSYFVDFFGKKAKTPKVVGSFAIKFSAPIISAFGFRNSDGVHQFNFELIGTPPYENTNEIQLTQSCSDVMEKHIRANPGQWAWFHRRWKSRPEKAGS